MPNHKAFQHNRRSNDLSYDMWIILKMFFHCLDLFRYAWCVPLSISQTFHFLSQFHFIHIVISNFIDIIFEDWYWIVISDADLETEKECVVGAMCREWWCLSNQKSFFLLYFFLSLLYTIVLRLIKVVGTLIWWEESEMYAITRRQIHLGTTTRNCELSKKMGLSTANCVSWKYHNTWLNILIVKLKNNFFKRNQFTSNCNGEIEGCFAQ